MEDKYEWLNKASRGFLEKSYLLEGTTPEQRIKDIANHAESILKIDGFAKKFEGYMSKGFYSLSTPVWCNFGLERGLPISCFSIELQDDTEDILRGVAEIGMMTKNGGGTATYLGNLRHRGAPITNNGVSNGSVSFLELFDTSMSVISQGKARRGYMAAYLPIDHPDIEEYLDIRSEGHPIQGLAFGVTIPEGWIQSMKDGDSDKRKMWAKVIKRRSESGFPYVLFEDNVNDNAPKVYRDKGMKLKSSNLCSEVIEFTDDTKSFTCCLSSINLLHIDEVLQTDAVQTLTYFLDAVLTDFIDKASEIGFMEKTVKFAKEHRSIGLGVLGWHSYLQSKLIPFESMEAKLLNAAIFKKINERSLQASKELANKFGEPEMLKGYGERFTTRIAIAPTTSSSFILGQVSPSIEPLMSNYFIKDLSNGKFTYKNPYLSKLLKEKDHNTKDTWESILKKGGSVQHLKFLTEREKLVFKTFGEISQLEIVQQAATRQKYIDQSQSLNLLIHPEASVKDINSLMLEAHALGVKTLYYQRSVNMAQEVGRNLMVCQSCEG